jgi:putative RNA 2'-phosphotransferase
MLGRKPDEFGLVPDSDGFITFKELLQAIHEEPHWHYVRRAHINEVLLGKDRHLFEPEDNRIKSVERHWRLDLENPTEVLPKLLFTPVRRRAHPVAMEKGLNLAQGKYLVLTPDQDMARRIGTRRDQKPVLLEIQAAAAQSQNVLFYSFGALYLSPQIAAKFISGPPVSKEVLPSPTHAEEKKERETTPRPLDLAAGTFFLDVERDPDLHRRAKGKKRKGWKEDARKIRRGKRR